MTSNNIQENDTASQKMAIVMGEMPAKTPTLTPEQKRIIRVQMLHLFFGLAMTAWLNGKTLGAAWHDAIRQMESFLASKSTRNPAVQYMRDAFASYRAYIARQTMTHPNRDLTINVSPEIADRLKSFAAGATHSALGKLNTTFSQFTIPASRPNTYADAVKKLQTQIQMQMYARNNMGRA